MDANPGRKPLELAPLDPPAAGTAGAQANAPTFAERRRELRITSADDCLARAASEYQGGLIDQALWDRSAAQSSNDEALAVAAYLRARATALRLQLRDERADKASAPAPVQDAAPAAVPVQSAEAPRSLAPGGAPASGRRKILVAASALAVAVVIVVTTITFSREDASLPPVAIAGTAAAAPARVPPPPAPAAAPQVDPTLEMKVQQLRSAGNWNVLVLYASEWTRKEPDNAAAWTQLSFGYTKMRQFGDALEAATKAVTLGPQDALAWVNLGQLNVALERPSEALVAFENVLALDPGHPQALCAAASIAKQQGRAKDADILAARLKAGSCADARDGIEIAIAGNGAARKTAPSGGR